MSEHDEPQDLSHLGGWDEHNPDRIAFAMSQDAFSDVASHLFQGSPPETVLLYKAWKDVLGQYPAYPAQEIGDCTSFGTGHANDLLQCVQIAIGKKPFEFHETCTEAIYGVGRELANMLGGGDGCYGGAVAKAVSQVGATDRKSVGPYSGSRAKSWGRSGVPADVKAKLAAHKVGSIALVATTDDVVTALANGNPCIVCSNQGFTMTRDTNGMCSAKGAWAHCMCIIGYRTHNGNKEFCIGQSWGPSTPSGPTTDDQPDFSFWITSSTLASMLRGQDSWALSAFDGWPGQAIPAHWTIGGFA
jgi:hypothetical protein